MAELLIELLSEEIPARMQGPAAAALAKAVRDGLAERGMALSADALQTYTTPRRLALVATGVMAAEPKRTVRRRGPRVDAPEAAQAGFRRSLQGAAFKLEEVEEKKGRFVVAVVEEGGVDAATVLQAILEGFLPRFPWPKSMRWGAGEARWVRPLQRIICLLDREVVPVRFAGLEAAAVTEGHRFMGGEPFVVARAVEYEDALHSAKVVADPAARRRLIVEGSEALAAGLGLSVRDDPALVDELVGLAEWPVPLMGRIDEVFMTLPPEVLTTSMRSHQKYLALDDTAGRLAPRFVVVANLEAADGGAAIVAGNERVLRARLWDARFFWETDQKVRLDARDAALARMAFHAKLGSMATKAARLERLARGLASRLSLGTTDLAGRAARLAKADLVTGMVGEFPELQGVMGAYYARAQGEPDDVADAIAGHYAPQGPSDACPRAPLAVVVALADKLDSLAGLYAAGERATGSGDPLGLRRLALGIMRLILENELRLPLRAVLIEAAGGYDRTLGLPAAETVADELLAFILDRFKVHLRSHGQSADLVAAVLAAGGDDDIFRLHHKVHAISRFIATADGANLLAGYRRARNIVRIEVKRDEVDIEAPIAAELLVEPAEIALHQRLATMTPQIAQALRAERFSEAMGSLATLRGPVDQFFEGVLVNAETAAVRANRLRLLARLSGLLDDVAVLDMLEEPHAAT